MGANDNSTVNLSGGSIARNLGVSASNATLNVSGTSLLLTGPSADDNSNTYYVLTGTLADGTVINNPVYLFNGAQISQIRLIDTDPLVALKAQVQALADAGSLSKGNTNALLVKLDAAQNAAVAGDVAGERGALTAFINQVKAFVRTGKIPTTQGTALLAAAQDILDSLK